MKCNGRFVRAFMHAQDVRYFRELLYRPNLVIRPADRNKHRLRFEQSFDFRGRDNAVFFRMCIRYFAAHPFYLAETTENRIMFDCTHYPVGVRETAANALQSSRISEDTQIVRFREPGCKDKFACFGTKNECDASTCIFKRFLRESTFRVNSAGIPEKTLRAPHSLQRFPTHRRRRRVIEIDAGKTEHSVILRLTNNIASVKRAHKNGLIFYLSSVYSSSLPPMAFPNTYGQSPEFHRAASRCCRT